MALSENQGTSSSVLRVVEIEGKGRGLGASQPLKGGQVVLRDSPILIYSAFPLKQQQQECVSPSTQYCSHCFRNLTEKECSLTCPSCSHPNDTVFCSHKCQSLALTSSHTPWICQALSFLRNFPPLVDHQPDEVQVQARYLLATFNLAMISPSSFQTLLSLDGSGANNNEGGTATAIFLHSLVSSLPFPEGLSAPSIEMIAALLEKDKRNAFGLMEPFSEHKGRSVRAYAIYPNASFFNHDCLPNACRFDYLDSATDGNTDMIVRMIHDIPEGREICVSYFPVNLSYSERQKRLLYDYGFSCSCDRCKVESNWSNDDDEGEGDGEDEAMEEEDANMVGSDGEENEIDHEGDDDFPHAYFFMRYMCDKENCGGTLAPLPPSDGNTSDIMECNVCGNLKRDEMGHYGQ